MTVFEAEIKGHVAGDDLEVRRTVTAIPSGQTLTNADFVVQNQDGTTFLTKSITASNQSGIGQIEDDGTTDQIGEIRFDLTSANTLLFQDEIVRHYQIRVKSSADKFYTVEEGLIKFVGSVVTPAIG